MMEGMMKEMLKYVSNLKHVEHMMKIRHFSLCHVLISREVTVSRSLHTDRRCHLHPDRFSKFVSLHHSLLFLIHHQKAPTSEPRIKNWTKNKFSISTPAWPFIETQLIIQILIKWERWEEWVNHSTSGFIRSTECWIQCAHGFLYHKHKLRRQLEHLDQTVQMKDSWHLNPRDSPAAHRETMQPHKKKEGQLVKWQQANGQRRNRGYTKRLRKKLPQEFRCCDTINLLSVSKMLN